jgi:PAS domain S-box-containing protein
MKDSDNYLQEIVNVLSAYVLEDYSMRLKPGDENDALNILANKVNALGERLSKEQAARKALEQSHSSTMELYKGLFENNAMAIVIMRLSDRVVLDVNHAGVRLFGFESKEHLIGKTGEELGVMTNPEIRDKAVADVQNDRQTTNKEVPVKTRSGEVRWITGSSNVVLVNGQRCMLTLMMDTTEKKKAEEEIRKRSNDLEQKIKQLKESEEKFLKAFHASSSGNTITRISDGSYVDVNDSFVKISGYSREELIGHTSSDLGMVVSMPRREKAMNELRELGYIRDHEISIKSKAGVQVDLLYSSETILVNGEKFSLNQIYDITERKQTELQLQFLNKELEAFSYSVSHDLRAPLRILNGYSEMLEEDYQDALDENGRTLIQTIRRNALRMNSLIDNLLEFSRMGRRELIKKKISMNEIMREARADVDHSAHNAKITIADMPVVKADQALLYQVVHNLMSNSVKYSSKKEHPVIEIGCEEKDSDYVFWFKDNGAGFDQNYAQKLFGVFQRLHTQEEFQGIGVGLAIVQRIILRHGGKVWAEGIYGEGATFYFSLPK